jgi:predicted enzyme related to lactoylglutathione lyase
LVCSFEEETSMEMTAYENGAPCWIDLMTTDRQMAIAFYSGITMAGT